MEGKNSGIIGKFLRHLRGIRTTFGFGSERSQNSSSTRSEERKVQPAGRGGATVNTSSSSRLCSRGREIPSACDASTSSQTSFFTDNIPSPLLQRNDIYPHGAEGGHRVNCW